MAVISALIAVFVAFAVLTPLRQIKAHDAPYFATFGGLGHAATSLLVIGCHAIGR